MNRHDVIETVARALCRAEGTDPDCEVRLPAPELFERPRAEDVLLEPGFGPAWKRYVRCARLHLAARDALAPASPPSLPPQDPAEPFPRTTAGRP